MAMTDQNINQLLAPLKDVDAYTHGHLPLATPYCRSLQITATINTLVASEMQFFKDNRSVDQVVDGLMEMLNHIGK